MLMVHLFSWWALYLHVLSSSLSCYSPLAPWSSPTFLPLLSNHTTQKRKKILSVTAPYLTWNHKCLIRCHVYLGMTACVNLIRPLCPHPYLRIVLAVSLRVLLREAFEWDTWGSQVEAYVDQGQRVEICSAHVFSCTHSYCKVLWPIILHSSWTSTIVS